MNSLIKKEDDFRGVVFDANQLRVWHEPVIRSLYADIPIQCSTCGIRFKCQDDHNRQMDWHVIKNRTIKISKKQKQRRISRMWLEALPNYPSLCHRGSQWKASHAQVHSRAHALSCHILGPTCTTQHWSHSRSEFSKQSGNHS
ncbi:PRE-MRNA CLEAVAGE COMPLEX II [Salix koriyanagi]|uniref:PRE-MRNA CLEAVAGE COMPLEX II n=1 Tax=Salix koriyanagi TaxID=2511006 RepID=A0A9Q0PN53_9ROSI|nr:PRE-MRNA CLEAVAGE COMPLEX II [Salix koriyanagi]